MCDKALESIEIFRSGGTPEHNVYINVIPVDASNVDQYLG